MSNILTQELLSPKQKQTTRKFISATALAIWIGAFLIHTLITYYLQLMIYTMEPSAGGGMGGLAILMAMFPITIQVFVIFLFSLIVAAKLKKDFLQAHQNLILTDKQKQDITSQRTLVWVTISVATFLWILGFLVLNGVIIIFIPALVCLHASLAVMISYHLWKRIASQVS
jgi:hypothetical protein